jgi:hypothetical protein
MVHVLACLYSPFCKMCFVCYFYPVWCIIIRYFYFLIPVWSLDPRVCYTIKGHTCNESASCTNYKTDTPCDVELLYIRRTDFGGREMSDYKQIPESCLRNTIVQQLAGIASV